MRDIRIEAIKNRLSPARGNALRLDIDPRADGIALFDQILHVGLELRHQCGVTAKEGILLHQAPIMGTRRKRPQLTEVASNLHAIALGQPFLGHRTRGDPHGGLARRRAPATAVIADAILAVIGIVSVSWSI